jgi:hypothetical protein
MNPVNKERLIHELARVIDPRDVPGVESYRLARAVMTLVQECDALDVLMLAVHLEKLNLESPRDPVFQPKKEDRT